MSAGRRVKYTVSKHAVNSKLIADQILSFVDDIIVGAGPRWHHENHRDLIVETIEEGLENFEQDGLIEQTKVMCDQRNNTNRDFEDGRFHLTVQYKQRNCLNTTRFDFVVTQGHDDSDGESVVI